MTVGQRGNKTTICVPNFSVTVAELNFISYLNGMLRLSASEFCEIPIIAEDLHDELFSCSGERSPELDGLPFEFSMHMKLWTSGELIESLKWRTKYLVTFRPS